MPEETERPLSDDEVMRPPGEANEAALSTSGHHHDQCECEAAGDEAPFDDPMRVF
jgi:hypothetical protein